MRAITVEDIIKLTELPFMRISRYDRDKVEENILALEGKNGAGETSHLANLIAYAIDYFTNIQKNTEKTKA